MMASRDTSYAMMPISVEEVVSEPQHPKAPESVISSRMTDITSDDGEEYKQDISNRDATHTSRQSLQTTGDVQSRPDTSTTGVSTRSPWAQLPPSRRGATGLSNQRLSMQGGISNTGRPQSSASKTSRTHVPSLTQHAFFRPMSSQRLQAQRGGSRPPTMSQQGLSDGESTFDTNASQAQYCDSYRIPNTTVQDEPEMPPPPSRGTEVTEPETSGRLTSNTSPAHGRPGASSMSESVRPLNKQSNAKFSNLSIDRIYKPPTGLAPPSKSPISFRSGLRLTTRENGGSLTPNRSADGREKLNSTASSLQLTPVGTSRTPDAVAHAQTPNLGKNYQYFTGNTRFGWGGRLQNSRDRPINIVTGLLVILPGVLFFVFSAPWLWHNISPAIPIVFAYIYYVCISSFLHASVTDPGVSPPPDVAGLFS